MLSVTYRRRLHHVALDQYGYVTTRDAEELGVPAVELRKLTQRGGLEHVSYGVYRFEDVPRTGRDQFMEAVLWAGSEAYLSHDSVLALHDLGSVNPRRIRVGTPKRVRAALPGQFEIIQQTLAPDELTIYEGIPSATVSRALLDCRGIVMEERLIDATRDAARLGLVSRRTADKVLASLGAVA